MAIRETLKRFLIQPLLVLSAACGTAQAQTGEVNIYSYRQPFLIKPVLQVFTQETGIKVNVVYAQKGLVERLENEGRNSRADLVLSADIGPLYEIASKGLTQAVDSETLRNNIPAHYRDPNKHWFGLTSRARIFYASKERVNADEPLRYEDLADPKWRGRICIRSGKHSYNLLLIATIIERYGEAQAQRWLQGVKSNLARKPQGNDRAQVKAVKEGVCDLALVNSYYFGKMITNVQKPEQIGWAKSVNLIFPNQAGTGTHMNISGVALLKHAPNRDNAIRLMEFLSSLIAQYMYAKENFEFPVRPGTSHSSLIGTYIGEFKADKIELWKAAANLSKAAKLVDRVGFDE